MPGLRLLTAAAVLLSLAACDQRPAESKREQCQRAREHIAELYTSGGDGDERRAREMAKHRRNLARVEGDDFLDRCERSMSASELSCLIASSSVAGLKDCRAGG